MHVRAWGTHVFNTHSHVFQVGVSTQLGRHGKIQLDQTGYAGKQVKDVVRVPDVFPRFDSAYTDTLPGREGKAIGTDHQHAPHKIRASTCMPTPVQEWLLGLRDCYALGRTTLANGSLRENMVNAMGSRGENTHATGPESRHVSIYAAYRIQGNARCIRCDAHIHTLTRTCMSRRTVTQSRWLAR